MQVGVFLLLLLAAHAALADEGCGVVRDGLQPENDLAKQTSRTTIAASWSGFGPNNVILYEWGVISSDLFAAAGLVPGRCQDVAMVPDVRAWEIVRNAERAIDTNMALRVHDVYHVVLRITYNTGHQLVAATDGVQLITETEMRELVGDTHQREHAHTLADGTTHGNADKKRAHLLNPVGVCPLDNANRCRQSEKNVGDFLRETYGPPVFNRDGAVTNLFRVGNPEDRVAAGLSATPGDDDDDNDDDDDGGGVPAWVLAPILIFLLLLALLVLLIVGIFLFAGRGEREARPASFKPTVEDTKDDGYAQGRGHIAAGRTDDTTKVEFPETDIRRLSITHNEAPNLDEIDAASPRMKKPAHPIMQTASSSFRDYQNA